MATSNSASHFLNVTTSAPAVAKRAAAQPSSGADQGANQAPAASFSDSMKEVSKHKVNEERTQTTSTTSAGEHGATAKLADSSEKHVPAEENKPENALIAEDGDVLEQSPALLGFLSQVESLPVSEVLSPLQAQVITAAEPASAPTTLGVVQALSLGLPKEVAETNDGDEIAAAEGLLTMVGAQRPVEAKLAKLAVTATGESNTAVAASQGLLTPFKGKAESTPLGVLQSARADVLTMQTTDLTGKQGPSGNSKLELAAFSDGLLSVSGKEPGALGLGLRATPEASLLSTAQPSSDTLGVNNAQLLPQPLAGSGRVSIPVAVTFGQPQWAGAMAEKAAWAVSQNIQTADIQIDPPELGPIQIKIHVHQDQASVSFMSQNPNVRDALDQSMARLKELLEEQGMELVDSGVSEHPQGQAEDEAQTSDSGIESGEVRDSAAHSETVEVDVISGIDYFA